MSSPATSAAQRARRPAAFSTAPRGAKFWPALGFAALSGSRATSGPLFISQLLAHQALAPGLAQSPLRFLAKPGVATTLKFLFAGESVGDKMPSSPDRTVPPQLAARVASGALVGATWYKAKGGSAAGGALVGALGAAAATYLTFYLRKSVSEATHTPTALVGAGEDALVLASGTALLKSQAS